MPWYYDYTGWEHVEDQEREFWQNKLYVWTDESEQYYRHWVGFFPNIAAAVNTRDYFYFKDADANLYWCRYWRKGDSESRWCYLSTTDYADTLFVLCESMFPAPECPRSLSIAGARVPPNQEVDLACLQVPPDDPFGHRGYGTNAGKSEGDGLTSADPILP